MSAAQDAKQRKRKRLEEEAKQTKLSFGGVALTPEGVSSSSTPTKKRAAPGKNQIRRLKRNVAAAAAAAGLPLQQLREDQPRHRTTAEYSATCDTFEPVKRTGAPQADYEYMTHKRRVLLSEEDLRAHEYAKHRMRKEDHAPDAQSEDLWFFALSYSYREQPNGAPEQQVYGVCPDGTGVCVRAPEFDPYLYAGMPEEWFTEYCQEDVQQMQSLGLRWLLYMREFTHRLLQQDEKLQRRYGRLLRDGHMILLPTEQEVREGVVYMHSKDPKGFRMDFRDDPKNPKQVFTPSVKLRLASPKLVPFVRQLLWYPMGISDQHCVFCRRCDTSDLLQSPFQQGCGPQGDNAADELMKLLGPAAMLRERTNIWHPVMKHHGSCPARYHGQCMRMWVRAMRLRGEIPAGSKFIARCPCCTSDVVEFEPASFGVPLPPPEPPQYPPGTQRHPYAPGHDGVDMDELAEILTGVGGYDRVDQELDYDMEMQDYEDLSGQTGIDNGNKRRNRHNERQTRWEQEQQQNLNKRKRDSPPGATTLPTNPADQDWRAQQHLRGWFEQFQMREMQRQGVPAVDVRWLPMPRPTEYEDLSNHLRAQRTETLLHPPTMTAYDANVGFVERFQTDTGIAPSDWYCLRSGEYRVVQHADDQRYSCCALEAVCHPQAPKQLRRLYNEDGPKSPDDDTVAWERARTLYGMRTAPVTSMTWDAEMRPTQAQFPEPHRNQVIQIGTLVRNYATNEAEMVYFVLGSVDRPPETEELYKLKSSVYTFDTERQLLDGFFMFERVVRPNVHITWNGNSFDVPYLLTRARLLGLYSGRNFGCRTRTDDLFWKGSKVRERAITQVFASGTIVIDGMYFAQVERAKLSDYFNLNTTSEALLGEHKVDLNYEQIDTLQRTSAGRTEILVYLAGDVYITEACCMAMNMLPNIFTRSRLFHTEVQGLLQRGTQFMWTCILRHWLREHQREHFGPDAKQTIFPCMRPPSCDPRMGDDALYEGAVVLPPLKGYYTKPVATVDFAGLYPSIMMKDKLCFSSYVPPELARRFGIEVGRDCWSRKRYRYNEDSIDTIDEPTNPSFMHDSVFKAVFPSIMLDFKNSRKGFKRRLAEEDKLYQDAVHVGATHVADGRALKRVKDNMGNYSVMEQAMKLGMNGGYGFVGLSRTRGQLAMPMVAETVTLHGQFAVHTARITVESVVCPANGYDYRVQVIYGDTDSVFFTPVGPNAHLVTIEHMMQLGSYLAKVVTGVFKGGLELEFEKVYCPLLLKGKKSYIGLKWEPNGSCKTDSKGVREVRRDCNNAQRQASAMVKDNTISNPNVEAAITLIGEHIQRIQAGKVPMHDMALTGSFTKDLFDPNATASGPFVAAYKEYQRSGRVVQPGERLRFVYTYEPHIEKDSTHKNTLTAELLQHAQEHQLTYDPKDAIDRVLKAVMPLMTIVYSSTKQCSEDDAKRLLTKRWTTGGAFMYHKEHVSTDVRANAVLRGLGVQVKQNCVRCKCTIEEAQPPQAATHALALAAQPPVPRLMPRPYESVRLLNMLNHGRYTQARVMLRAPDPVKLVRLVVQERVPEIQLVQLGAETGYATQLRMTGSSVQLMLRRWCDNKSPLHRDRYGDRGRPRLCRECVAEETNAGEPQLERLPQMRELRRVQQNMLKAWDTCRACSGTRMRGEATVVDCSTASCGNHGNRMHYTRFSATEARTLVETCSW